MPGQVDVEQQHVRPEHRRQRERLLGGGRLADELDVRRGDCLTHGRADQGMVVDQHHPQLAVDLAHRGDHVSRVMGTTRSDGRATARLADDAQARRPSAARAPSCPARPALAARFLGPEAAAVVDDGQAEACRRSTSALTRTTVASACLRMLVSASWRMRSSSTCLRGGRASGRSAAGEVGAHAGARGEVVDVRDISSPNGRSRSSPARIVTTACLASAMAAVEGLGDLVGERLLIVGHVRQRVARA